MKKKALWKSNIREIFQTKARFFSILLIILLGVCFYAGIKATGPDMINTADTYFKDQNLMDTKVMSTIGLEQKDLELIKENKNVETVEAGYSVDVVEKQENQILKLISYDEKQTINKPLVVKGRLPKKTGEIALDSQAEELKNYNIGDIVTIDDKDNQFKQTSFEIVGLVQSPMYIDRISRGNTTVGKGAVDLFGVIPTEDFGIDVFTDIYVTYKGTDKKVAFSQSYEDQVEKDQKELEKSLQSRIDSRFEKIKSEGNQQITDGQKKIADAKILLEDSKKQLAQAKEEFQTQKSAIEAAEAAGQVIPDAMKAPITQGEEELITKEKELVSEVEKLGTNEKDLKEQAEVLAKLDEPKYLFTDRNSNPAYSEYNDNADRISSIATVFPVFFFMIAALICLTTMTRMVEEKRGEIGTLKALGYSNGEIAQKFILYAFLASVMGSALGLVIGFNLFPTVIFNAYGSLYNLPPVIITYYASYSIQSVVVAILCTIVSALVVLRVDLLSTPAVLMRPKAPKPGKRILLERIPWLWSKFNFNQKVTARNLFRYKQRMLMTVLGIAGCMAMIVTGFGLKDSIGDIVNLQFSKIWHYDATVTFNPDATEKETKDYEEKRDELTNLRAHLDLAQNTVEVSKEDYKNQEVTVDVPKNIDELKEFITFRDRVTGEVFKLDDTGVIINEKLAKLFDVKEGDLLQIQASDDNVREVKVNQIVENYAMHFIYMTPTYYEKVFEQKPDYNVDFLRFKKSIDSKEEEKLAESLMDTKKAINVTFTSEISSGLDDTMGSLNIVVWVLIISAAMLAFIVLYNLTNINISERIRELSTMKVLGFYDKEVTMYVYRENNILTALGILLGCVLGKLLHGFVMKTAEVDLMMFPPDIHIISYVYSALLTILFSLIVMYFMHRRLKNVDMIESLKSNE